MRAFVFSVIINIVNLFNMKYAFTIIPIWDRRLLLVIGVSKSSLLKLCSQYSMGRGIRNMIHTTPPFPKSEGHAYSQEWIFNWIRKTINTI